ncbi:MAG: hypothetical protein AAGA65_10345 [Actinomycetota bacterium]
MSHHPEPDRVGHQHGHLVPLTDDELTGAVRPSVTHHPTTIRHDEVRAIVAHVAAIAHQEAAATPHPVDAAEAERSPLAEPGVWIVLIMLALVTVVAIVATVAVLALAVTGG